MVVGGLSVRRGLLVGVLVLERVSGSAGQRVSGLEG